jgi:heme/copper-type cytochrome/quinol oxidase subunit 4
MYLHLPTTHKPNKKGFIDNTSLIIIAFSVVFYSRIFCSITRAPSILNLAHFAVVPLVLGIILFTSRTKDHKQISIAYSFLFGLVIFLIAVLVSALWNNTGLINAIVSFMMLAEPFIFLLSIVCIPLPAPRNG